MEEEYSEDLTDETEWERVYDYTKRQDAVNLFRTTDNDLV